VDGVIERLIESAGVLGVFVLMFVENIFPPIPSEVVMPLAGYAAARGSLPMIPLIFAGTLGSLLGATVWFVVARWFGEARLRRWADRFGRILTLTQRDIDRAEALFMKRGHIVVLFGRLIPAIRTIISVPAGLAAMSWGTFLLYSFIGSLAWTTALMMAGYWLGSSSDAIGDFIGPISLAIVAVCVVVYIVRLITYPRRRRREAAMATEL
jgi:membrane protein DedA with SNARE-associated domain